MKIEDYSFKYVSGYLSYHYNESPFKQQTETLSIKSLLATIENNLTPESRFDQPTQYITKVYYQDSQVINMQYSLKRHSATICCFSVKVYHPFLQHYYPTISFKSSDTYKNIVPYIKHSLALAEKGIKEFQKY